MAREASEPPAAPAPQAASGNSSGSSGGATGGAQQIAARALATARQPQPQSLAAPRGPLPPWGAPGRLPSQGGTPPRALRPVNAVKVKIDVTI